MTAPLDPVGVSAAAKALWDTRARDDVYAAQACVAAYLAVAGSPADERLREVAEQAVFACLPVLHIVGSQNRGYAVCRDIDTQVTADPELWANAAHAVCELHAALAGVSAEASGVWPDQSAQHAVLLDQIKDAYAEGKAEAVALIRERAALALPDLVRFTLDEIEAIVGVSAEAAPDDGWTPTSDNPSPAEWECELCGGRLDGPGEKCGSAQHGPAGSVIHGRAVPVGGPIPDAEFGVVAPPPNPYPLTGPRAFSYCCPHTIWAEGFAAGLAARDTSDAALVDALRELLAHPRSAAASLAARQALAAATGESVGEQMFGVSHRSGDERTFTPARDTPDGECRAPHCWSEYGTPCGTCPKEKR